MSISQFFWQNKSKASNLAKYLIEDNVPLTGIMRYKLNCQPENQKPSVSIVKSVN